MVYHKTHKKRGGMGCHTKKGGMGCHTKKGGKAHTRRVRKTRRSHKGGASLLAAVKTALVPFTLFKAQKHAQKKSRKTMRRTRKK